MKSLYPILWTVALEVVYNVYSATSVATMIYIVIPSGNPLWHEVANGVDNIVRELILIGYCVPFLVFNDGRHKQLFLNKIGAEGQAETQLYFQQLQDQWAK
uniref:Serpentine receptor class gamma n=1 Tax=Panagrellus redivivus TaxID=6233 RepID=A0A7E4ZY71_PANRE